MKNPWIELSVTPPYVLKEEREAIERFNETNPDSDTRVRFDVLPEPFIGNPDADVVVLSLNPGWDDSDREWHAREDFAASIWANLRHEPQTYPFYPINPDFSQSGAYRWWRRRLDDLIQDTSLFRVANNVLCIEWFPYHSVSYKAIPKWIASDILPSQQYAITLVEAAIARGASIVAMRKYRDWERRVPALREYPKLYSLSSTQSGHLSRNNLLGYSSVVEVLKRR